MCVAFGVPLWWKTTTTYRASLPYNDIEQVFKQETTCKIPITLVLCSQKSDSGSSVKELEAQLAKSLMSGQDGRSSLSMQYSIYSRNCLTAERRFMEESSSVEEFDRKLSTLHQDSVGQITLYILEDSSVYFPDKKINIHVGQQRAIYIKGSKLEAPLELTAALIKTVIVSEASLDKHYKTARGVIHTVADLESMRSFRYTPGYELSFTLLIPEPQNILGYWNLEKSQQVYLDPMTRKLEEFAEFTVASQVLYYTGLSVKPKKKDSSFYFPHSSLPHIITPVEAKLGSHVTNFPNLNFIVYIPPVDQSPLYIHSSDGNPVSTNAFLSPRWGGVLIYNTPIPDENATSPLRVEVKSQVIMPVFLAQLRLLLGIPSPDNIESVLLEEPKEQSILDWEYDSLLRRHCIENLASASASLFSLSQLLEKISNIVINDDIAKQVYTAVESIQSGHRFLAEGKLHPAFHASKRALIASEKAFFDPSLLQLLYFPDDQKFAIYIPLFLPVSIPVVLSLIKAVQWIKQQRKKDKVD
nr:GPI transamidase component PIG-S-like [Lytechinus pictus]